jgi:hypothetical protein
VTKPWDTPEESEFNAVEKRKVSCLCCTMNSYESEFNAQQRQETFLFSIAFRSALGVTHPHIQEVQGHFLGGKVECEVLTSEIKNACSYTSILLYIIKDQCLIIHSENFTFYFQHTYQKDYFK